MRHLSGEEAHRHQLLLYSIIARPTVQMSQSRKFPPAAWRVALTITIDKSKKKTKSRLIFSSGSRLAKSVDEQEPTVISGKDSNMYPETPAA
jgi:hypothetical protein